MNENELRAETMTLVVNAAYSVEVLPSEAVLPPGASVVDESGEQPVALVFTVGARREVFLLNEAVRQDLRQALAHGLLVPERV